MSQDLEKEEMILQAAMDVFIEKGWHGAKMQEIADKAEINKAMLHYYFRNKETLYHKIFEKVFKTFFSQLGQYYRKDLPLEQFLKLFIDKYMDLLKTQHKIPMFILRELSEGGKMVPGIIRKISENVDDWLPPKLIQMLEKEKKQGLITDIDAVQFIITMLGSCIFYFIAEPMVKSVLPMPDDYDRDAFIEKRKKQVFKVLYYGIKPRGAEA